MSGKSSSWGLNLFVLFELQIQPVYSYVRSWELNLFVLFELLSKLLDQYASSWGLNLFVLFEPSIRAIKRVLVLEDWIYLYYLNRYSDAKSGYEFLRIEFICIIWTKRCKRARWILFLRIEFICIIWTMTNTENLEARSWGLNLFVLFEREDIRDCVSLRSWGLNLFVLFELTP